MSEARYLAIEGPIGVGATSLAKGIARRLNSELVLDQAEKNPFLRLFYQDPARYALPTQLGFLRIRSQQQRKIPEMLGRHIVSDYLFARDALFARMTLTDEEFDLYSYYASLLKPAPPKPDLVIYLQANPEILMERITKRGRDYERGIELSYLQQVVDMYNQFFFHYKETPLLVINTAEIDFVHDSADLTYLLEEVDRSRAGTRYYSATKQSTS
jgi:deoxyadenosine/deoxycytidine kinase